MNVSKRISVINPSPTLAITAKANQMKAEGINVVGFGAGEPDFDTPDHIKDAAVKALKEGFTKYTPTSGTKQLKEAICKKFKNDNGLDYTPAEVLVSCGAKHSIFNAVLAVAGDGDEVILPSPFWVSYPEMIRFAGAKPVFIQTTEESGFKVTPEQLAKAITPKTKLFILNSPSNPTGMVYSKSELEALAKVIVEKNILCLSDEIYEKLIYEGEGHTSIASFNEKIKALTITVNGVSKSYSMTGWRIGYTAGPKPIIQAMSNLQDHSTSNPTSIAQAATVAALEGTQEPLKKMNEEFRKRRDAMVSKVNAIRGLHVRKPDGAFYCFVGFKDLIGRSIGGKKIDGSMTFTEMLLTQANVAVVPGGVFGDDAHIRLSYATSMKNIDEGLARIEKFTKTAV